MSNIEDIKERIRACLDLANHPGTPAAEAETALAMAQRLMTKYALDEAAVGGRVDEASITRDFITIEGTYAMRRLGVVAAIAGQNSCACFRSTSRGSWVENRHGRMVRPKTGYELHLFGTAADIFATKTLWAAVEMYALRTMPKGDKSFRHSWWVGFEIGITKALQKAVKEAVEETGGTSLVLVEKYKRASEEMRASVRLKSGGPSVSARRRDAFSTGMSAGQAFSAGAGIRSGAIGALGQ